MVCFGSQADLRPGGGGENSADRFVEELERGKAQSQHENNDKRAFNPGVLRYEMAAIQTVDPAEQRIMKAIQRVRHRAAQDAEAVHAR